MLARLESIGVKKIQLLVAKAGGGVERAERPNPAGAISGLLAQFASGAGKWIFVRLGGPGRELPKRRLDGVPILPHQDDAAGFGDRQDRERTAVFDDVEAMRRGGAVVPYLIDADIEDATFENALRGECSGLVAHAPDLAEPLRRASYLSTVSQPRSSVLVEIGWLAYFVVVFVVAVYVLVGLLVPHHFNDKIAIALAAIFAGLIMIATRAWMTARVRPR